MSAVNPASVVNPAGMSQIPPPSAIGPGAILTSNTNGPLAVGPGFGSNNNRGNQQYSKLPVLVLEVHVLIIHQPKLATIAHMATTTTDSMPSLTKSRHIRASLRPTLHPMEGDTVPPHPRLDTLPRVTTRRVLASLLLPTPPLHSQLTLLVAIKVRLARVPILVAKLLPHLSTRLASTRPC